MNENDGGEEQRGGKREGEYREERPREGIHYKHIHLNIKARISDD
jgi:hypothetical protein